MGRLSGLSYPAAGLSLSYAYDAYGRLNKVSATLNGQALTLADSFVYQPGSASALAWRLGNNLNRQITRDADGRVTQLASPGAHNLSLSWNNNDTVSQISDNLFPALTAGLNYDAAQRLANVSRSGDP